MAQPLTSIAVLGDIPLDRLEVAAEKAIAAFYASVAESFPEAVTGDMMPGDDALFRWQANVTLFQWLRNNHPSVQDQG